MWKKVALAGAVGAAILGSGVAAIAATGNHNGANSNGHGFGEMHGAYGPMGAPGFAPGEGGASGPGRHGMGRFGGKFGGNLEHGEFVTRENGKDVTRDVIRGSVTSVSATSIAVRAADGFSLTFVVNGDTRVRARDGDKAADSISQIKQGDSVMVAGTKAGSTLTANHVLRTAK